MWCSTNPSVIRVPLFTEKIIPRGKNCVKAAERQFLTSFALPPCGNWQKLAALSGQSNHWQTGKAFVQYEQPPTWLTDFAGHRGGVREKICRPSGQFSIEAGLPFFITQTVNILSAAGSFTPTLLLEKLEIHKVFLNFPNFDLCQNLPATALADLFTACFGVFQSQYRKFRL